MDLAIEQPRRFKVRRAAFFVVLVLFLALCFYMAPIPLLVLGWFIEIEPGQVSHAIHDISFGALFALAAVGLLSQLRHPADKVALAYQVTISIGVLIVLALAVDRMLDPLIGVFTLAIVLMLTLHPAGRRILTPETGPSPVLLGAAAVLAIPLAVYAFLELRLASEAAELFKPIMASLPADADESAIAAAIDGAGLSSTQHAAVEHSFHWTVMAAYAITCVVLAFVAALRPGGWRIVAWSVAAAVAIFGAASLVFPHDASAVGTVWAVLAIAWGIGFAAFAHREGRRTADRDEEPAVGFSDPLTRPRSRL